LTETGGVALKSGETVMHWNSWIRQTHRWLSIVFTATVIANFVAMALGKPPSWLVYSPLPPLFLMLFTGLYMFVLPYAAKWRSHSSMRRFGTEKEESA
jgi:cellulose synthase/poly-beta-1,6-N-acetylglucosamine synthase-like glycosyltransferase